MAAAITDESHAFDVLVIGAGSAGLRAAIEAASAGARTAIVCKSLLGKAQTVMAEGGIAAAVEDGHAEPRWQDHFCDTLRAGLFVGDWQMAQVLAQEAPQRIHELEAWGAVFDRDVQGLIASHAGSGHRDARLVRAGERSGMQAMRALQQRIAQLNIPVFMECTITRLLTDGERIRGAFGYRRQNGGLLAFECPSVVLATGGGARAWKVNANAAEHTADGIGLALDAGAELIDMEFVQFHPTGLVWPESARGMLVSETARMLGATLTNAAGQRFMQGDRRKELAAGYRVGRAIQAEIAAGRGGPHGGALLDLAACGALQAHHPALVALRRQLERVAGITDSQTADAQAPGLQGNACIEVAPTCFYCLGGVRVDALSCATRVPGLFAAGETAGGLHGADRLIGNALSESLVFGRRAGQHAARRAKEAAHPRGLDAARVKRCADELRAPLGRRKGESPFTLNYELQDCMHDNLGLTRSAAGLALARDKLQRLVARLQRVAVSGPAAFNPGLQLALELHHLLPFAQAVTAAAIARTESRGSHARTDAACLDPQFNGVNLVVSRSAQGLAVAAVHRTPPPVALRQLFNGVFNEDDEGMPSWPENQPGSEPGKHSSFASGEAMPKAASSAPIG